MITPIRDIVDVMMLSLRRRFLEQYLQREFDPVISLELDAVIAEQEQLKKTP